MTLTRLLLDIIWLVLAGFWMALGYALAALICFLLIVTIPFGIAAVRIGAFALWPAFPAGRWGQPDDIAKIVSWLVSPESAWLTGQVIDAEGGFRR